jgi:glycosyltransferase involved in cell wall biosynthesis
MPNNSLIKNVALMVCTYKRPVLLSKFLQSVEHLNIPDGVNLHVAVADNNAERQYDNYIRLALERLPFAYSYGHEPRQGYSNARNIAVELALATPAQLLGFVDDDLELDPDWLIGHLRSYREFDCDIVGGIIEGKMNRYEHGSPYQHGEICRKYGTGNVMFKRWIVDSENTELRFDPQFNKTGREDQAFFSEATKQGAKFIFSTYPVVYNSIMSGESWVEELTNKASVSAIMHRNDIVRLRKEKGFLHALGGAVWSLRFGGKYLLGNVELAVRVLLGQTKRAELKRVSNYKNGRKMIEAFKGLRGDFVSRSDIRR